MPYDRRYTKRAPRRPRGGKSTAYRKAVLPRKRKTDRNVLATQGYRQLKLQRKVNFLMDARWGPVQKNFQISDLFTPLASQPVCFDATDFTCRRINSNGDLVSYGAPIYQVNTVGTGLTNPAYFDPAINQNPYWDACNADIPDGGVYKPLYAKYIFQVSGRNSVDDTYIDIKLLQMKKGTFVPQGSAPPATFAQRIMPYALMHMQYLADYSNMINTDFFKVYSTKRLYLNSQTSITAPTPGAGANQSGVIQTTGNTKFCHFSIKPKKVRRQLTSWPSFPGATMSTLPGATIPDDVEGGAFGIFNVPVDQPLWFVISVNDRTALDGDSVQVKVTRMVYWRDPIGNSTVRA